MLSHCANKGRVKVGVLHRHPAIGGMKMSSDTRKAISVILIYVPFLSFLIGMAARLKESFHSRVKPSRRGFTAPPDSCRWGETQFLFPPEKGATKASHR